MSFTCDHCGYQNNEIQPGGSFQTQGVRIELIVSAPEDLNRRVVKSDYSSVRIVEIDFEIPPQSQKGEVTTVEGIIERVVLGLDQDQPIRRKDHPEAAAQIDDFIARLRKLKELEKPFTLIIEDASGNCFVENPLAPSGDPKMKTSKFCRTKEQDQMLGCYDPSEVLSEKNEDPAEHSNILQPIAEGSHPLEEFDKEVLQFQTNCPDCAHPCETNMKVTRIPHFKEVIIMATTCEHCGHRTNEVKSGSGIEEKGVRIELKIRTKEDFSRDLLKSEFCSLTIRELECDVGAHALGGRFTTCEGLLVAIKEQLLEQSGMFFDSQDVEQKKRMEAFFAKLDAVLESKMEVTLVLDDPSGNSYVQSLTDDLKDDDGLRLFKYHRSHAQNEELGINDMVTENYEISQAEGEDDDDDEETKNS